MGHDGGGALGWMVRTPESFAAAGACERASIFVAPSTGLKISSIEKELSGGVVSRPRQCIFGTARLMANAMCWCFDGVFINIA